MNITIVIQTTFWPAAIAGHWLRSAALPPTSDLLMGGALTATFHVVAAGKSCSTKQIMSFKDFFG
eukprot:3125193-Amphidinium_carterae.1